MAARLKTGTEEREGSGQGWPWAFSHTRAQIHRIYCIQCIVKYTDTVILPDHAEVPT